MDDNFMNDVNDEMEDVLQAGREMLDELHIGETVDELKTEAELLIRKHPIKSVLVGVVTGFLLARVLRGD